MRTKYQIELADNGMIVRKDDFGEIRVFEYDDSNVNGKYSPISLWIGDDIIDDMLESPDIQEEIEKLLQRTGEDCVNDFEITIEIKPIIK